MSGSRDLDNTRETLQRLESSMPTTGRMRPAFEKGLKMYRSLVDEFAKAKNEHREAHNRFVSAESRTEVSNASLSS